MYTPAAFRGTDDEATRELIDGHPFATLIARQGDALEVTHLPLIRRETEGAIRLLGHLSRANPMLRLLEAGAEATAVFHGPHAYITPTWYAENDVPTWNYAVVHARGRARMLEGPEAILDAVMRLSSRFERDSERPWSQQLPADLASPAVVARAIGAFVIEVERVEAKFKLNQNRSLEDQRRVIEGLSARSDEASELRIGMPDLLPVVSDVRVTVGVDPGHRLERFAEGRRPSRARGISHSQTLPIGFAANRAAILHAIPNLAP